LLSLPLAASVLVIGNTTADVVLATEHGLQAGAKVQARSVARYSGGQAANTAWTLARLGIAVEFVGAFGDDEAGRLAAAELRQAGASLAGSTTVPRCPSQTGYVVVDASSGERSIVVHRDPRLRLDSDVGPLTASASMLFLDGHEPTASQTAARQARSRGIPVIADAEVATPEISALLPHISCLIAPVGIICQLAHTDNAAEAVMRLTDADGSRTVVATDGARGALGARPGSRPLHIPAARCMAIDTTGAGDAFHAGYIAAAIRGFDFKARLAFASELAAAQCEVAGPRVSPKRIERFRIRLAGGVHQRHEAGAK
jgi:sugar/nucleoside kinase (ribokinase family)